MRSPIALQRSWARPGRDLRRLVLASAAVLVVGALPMAAAVEGAPPAGYVQTNLVANLPGVAQITDPLLKNPWGMSFSATSPVWVSDNGADVATLYAGATSVTPITKVSLTVSIPDGAPTGQVFNPTTAFAVIGSSPARFIFASENGSIDAWAGALGTTAQSMVTVPGAVYKGLALATGSAGSFLYAANFHDARIDVFDTNFDLTSLAGTFQDPELPAGYAPFNVASINGQLFVTYAKQDADAHDDVAGQAHGFVDVFDLQGNFVRRLIQHGHLNSPWGMAIAPSGFGQFSGDLLVGNFGDGRINAYDPVTGEFAGVLSTRPGRPIEIEGLWGLLFGTASTGTPTTLFFSAGPNDEQDGLLGSITVAP